MLPRVQAGRRGGTNGKTLINLALPKTSKTPNREAESESESTAAEADSIPGQRLPMASRKPQKNPPTPFSQRQTSENLKKRRAGRRYDANNPHSMLHDVNPFPEYSGMVPRPGSFRSAIAHGRTPAEKKVCVEVEG